MNIGFVCGAIPIVSSWFIMSEIILKLLLGGRISESSSSVYSVVSVSYYISPESAGSYSENYYGYYIYIVGDIIEGYIKY